MQYNHMHLNANKGLAIGSSPRQQWKESKSINMQRVGKQSIHPSSQVGVAIQT